MKKLLSFLLVVGLVLVLCPLAFADSSRTSPLKTSGVLTSNQLVRGRGIDVYRIMCNGTGATSQFGLYDVATKGLEAVADCEFEIYEATSGEGHYIDFGENPLKFDTGCSLVIYNGAIVLHYR